MFSGCESLRYLPNIAIWDMNKVENIEGLFMNCSSLLLIPDISKWNISKIININDIFKGCSSSLNLPDISKWFYKNIIIQKEEKIFVECSSSNESTSKEGNSTGSINSENNIDSSGFLNDIEKKTLNYVNEYKDIYDNINYDNESLISYYDNFYS